MKSMMKLVAAPAIAALLAFVPSPAQAAKPSPFTGIPISSVAGSPNVFSGTMDVIGFATDGCTVNAIALINGTLTPAAGAAQQVSNVVAMVPVKAPSLANACTSSASAAPGFGGTALTAAPIAVAQAAGSCSILHLDLGPLHLDLLGLVVDLNEVVLDITAQPGNGNLLGNLLCGITNLLNGFNRGGILQGALANALTNLLNSLLGAL